MAAFDAFDEFSTDAPPGAEDVPPAAKDVPPNDIETEVYWNDPLWARITEGLAALTRGVLDWENVRQYIWNTIDRILHLLGYETTDQSEKLLLVLIFCLPLLMLLPLLFLGCRFLWRLIFDRRKTFSSDRTASDIVIVPQKKFDVELGEARHPVVNMEMKIRDVEARCSHLTQKLSLFQVSTDAALHSIIESNEEIVTQLLPQLSDALLSLKIQAPLKGRTEIFPIEDTLDVDEDEMEEVEKDDDDDETEEEEDEDLDFDYGDDYDDDDEDDDGFDGYFIRPPNSNQNFVYMDDDEAYIITDEVFENEYEKDQLIVVNEPEEDIEETQQRQAEVVEIEEMLADFTDDSLQLSEAYTNFEDTTSYSECTWQDGKMEETPEQWMATDLLTNDAISNKEYIVETSISEFQNFKEFQEEDEEVEDTAETESAVTDSTIAIVDDTKIVDNSEMVVQQNINTDTIMEEKEQKKPETIEDSNIKPTTNKKEENPKRRDKKRKKERKQKVELEELETGVMVANSSNTNDDVIEDITCTVENVLEPVTESIETVQKRPEADKDVTSVGLVELENGELISDGSTKELLEEILPVAEVHVFTSNAMVEAEENQSKEMEFSDSILPDDSKYNANESACFLLDSNQMGAETKNNDEQESFVVEIISDLVYEETVPEAVVIPANTSLDTISFDMKDEDMECQPNAEAAKSFTTDSLQSFAHEVDFESNSEVDSTVMPTVSDLNEVPTDMAPEDTTAEPREKLEKTVKFSDVIENIYSPDHQLVSLPSLPKFKENSADVEADAIEKMTCCKPTCDASSKTADTTIPPSSMLSFQELSIQNDYADEKTLSYKSSTPVIDDWDNDTWVQTQKQMNLSDSHPQTANQWHQPNNQPSISNNWQNQTLEDPDWIVSQETTAWKQSLWEEPAPTQYSSPEDRYCAEVEMAMGAEAPAATTVAVTAPPPPTVSFPPTSTIDFSHQPMPDLLKFQGNEGEAEAKEEVKDKVKPQPKTNIPRGHRKKKTRKD